MEPETRQLLILMSTFPMMWAVLLVVWKFLPPGFWNVIMVFLGSWLVGDFIVYWFIDVDGGKAKSGVFKGHITPNVAFVIFVCAIVLSSGLALFGQFGAQIAYAQQPIAFPVASSLVVAGLLWVDFYRLYTRTNQSTSQDPEPSQIRPTGSCVQAKSRLQ